MQGIDACAAWKATYARTKAAVAAASPNRPWDFDEGTIFAHTAAFVQRCRSLTRHPVHVTEQLLPG